MTAHAMKGDRERCLAAGMDGYVAKPLEWRALLAAIRNVTGDAHPTQTSLPVQRPAIEGRRLLERVGGDRKALSRLAKIFLADSSSRLSDIRRALAKRDGRKLREAAHALKGAVSNFAAPAATEAAQRLQQIAESGTLDGADVARTSLEKEIARVRKALVALVPSARALPSRRKTAAPGRPRRRRS